VDKAKAKNVKMVFPVDFITASKFDKNAEVGEATDQTGIPDGWLGLDVGPKTSEIYKATVLESKTILWNGWVSPATHRGLVKTDIISQQSRWCLRVPQLCKRFQRPFGR
jgi:Phosphoglycerate kinase